MEMPTLLSESNKDLLLINYSGGFTSQMVWL